MTGGGQGVEEQVEVHEPTVGPPGPPQLDDGVVAGRRWELEAPSEVVSSPDVVAGQHVIAAKPSKERVLGAPAPDAGEVEQDCERTFVRLVP